MNEFVLCYIDGCWAYFTTQKLEDQWGDDWNDAPYEHNAGKPCEYSKTDNAKGRKPWEIYRVAFRSLFSTPSDNSLNSLYSVEAINGGAVAWLTDFVFGNKPIMAGTTYPTFKKRIIKSGGMIYEPVKAIIPE